MFLWIDSNVSFCGYCKQKSPAIIEPKARKELAGGEPGQWGVAPSGMRVRHLNLTNASHSGALQAPLSKSAGGWGLCKSKEGKPVFADVKDIDYMKMLSAIKQVQHRVYPGVKQLLAGKPAVISKTPKKA